MRAPCVLPIFGCRTESGRRQGSGFSSSRPKDNRLTKPAEISFRPQCQARGRGSCAFTAISLFPGKQAQKNGPRKPRTVYLHQWGFGLDGDGRDSVQEGIPNRVCTNQWVSSWRTRSERLKHPGAVAAPDFVSDRLAFIRRQNCEALVHGVDELGFQRRVSGTNRLQGRRKLRR